MGHRFIDPIPEEFRPDEKDNVVSEPVFRAVHSKEMVINNFLPSYIEKPRNPNSFLPVNKSYYSMSVFRSLEECEKTIRRYPNIANTIVGYAVGKTNINKGIALSPSSFGHIDYFLFDYQNNNPCVDFEYFKDK